MSVAHKGLTRISDLLQPELFDPPEPSTEPTEGAPVTVTRRMHRRAAAMTQAIQERTDQQQDRGFLSRPFALCNLPVRRNPAAVYERRNGKFTLRIEAGQGKDLPYGQDRLVLILLATLAVQRKTRSLELGTASDILRMFGRTPDGRAYKRLIDAFERIFSATIYWSTDGGSGQPSKLISKHRLALLDSIHLWYDDDNRLPTASYTNKVVLSDAFFRELTAHPVPLNFTVVRELIATPAVLDFYIWSVYRAYTVPEGDSATVPLFGPTGLQSQLGLSIAERYKFRQTVRHMITQVRGFWPELPVTMSANGDELHIDHAVDLHPRLN